MGVSNSGVHRGDRNVDELPDADAIGVRDLRIGGEEFGQGDSAAQGDKLLKGHGMRTFFGSRGTLRGQAP